MALTNHQLYNFIVDTWEELKSGKMPASCSVTPADKVQLKIPNIQDTFYGFLVLYKHALSHLSWGYGYMIALIDLDNPSLYLLPAQRAGGVNCQLIYKGETIADSWLDRLADYRPTN